MILNTQGVRVVGHEAAYCSKTGRLTPLRVMPGGRYKCLGCGASVRLVDTDPVERARRAA